MSRFRWKARPLLLHPLRVAFAEFFGAKALKAIMKLSRAFVLTTS
jgi:hypothetical protein